MRRRCCERCAQTMSVKRDGQLHGFRIFLHDEFRLPESRRRRDLFRQPAFARAGKTIERECPGETMWRRCMQWRIRPASSASRGIGYAHEIEERSLNEPAPSSRSEEHTSELQ